MLHICTCIADSVRTQNTSWMYEGLAVKFEDEADSTTSVTDIGLVVGTTYYVKEVVQIMILQFRNTHLVV